MIKHEIFQGLFKGMKLCRDRICKKCEKRHGNHYTDDRCKFPNNSFFTSRLFLSEIIEHIKETR